MKILLADQNNLEDVRNITQTTIRAIYPKYYPDGAVDFFSKHHSDEHIRDDISAGKVYILNASIKAMVRLYLILLRKRY